MQMDATSPHAQEISVGLAEVLPKAGDRRRSHRDPCPALAWLAPQSGKIGARQQQVAVSDLSLHGVGFISDEPLEMDAVHWIVIGTGSLHVSSRARVIACRQREAGGYDVGAEFF